MTQDQHNEEWLKEAADLAERLHYAAYTWGFDVAKCGATTDTTIAMNRAKEKLDALLAHLQQRPLPVREGTHRWNIERDGDDLLVCFNLHDKGQSCEYERFVRSPSLPVREEPTPLSDERILHLWDIYVGYATGAPSARKMPLSNEDKLTFARAVLAASPPSVQNSTNGVNPSDGAQPSEGSDAA